MSKALLGWLQKCALVVLALSFLSGVWPSWVTHLADAYLDEPTSRDKRITVLDGPFKRAHAVKFNTPAGTKGLPDRTGDEPEPVLTTEAARLGASRDRAIVRVDEVSWRYVPGPSPLPQKTGPPAT